LPTTLPDPSLSFLLALDPIAGEPAKIPYIGGFAVTQHYVSPRMTVDLDVIDVAPGAKGAKGPRSPRSIGSASTTRKIGELSVAGIHL
jgi:hypothetical protein